MYNMYTYIYIYIYICVYIYIYIYTYIYISLSIGALTGSLARDVKTRLSGGRLCTLIGVPWRGVSFSTLSMGRFVLKQYICKGAESAEHAETAGYTYEGTPTTA